MNKLCLGIDTSNYKTSVALVDRDGHILYNLQDFLKVKEHGRGLRQSDAFYQHANRLPDILYNILDDNELRAQIGSVSVSSRPRPVKNSYMPVFNAGLGMGKVVAKALNVPLYQFSHQEGHIEAVKFYSKLKHIDNFIAFHLSGGTCEAVLSDYLNRSFHIVGGSYDISFGQVIDRIGVSLGFDFPCGEEMDHLIGDTSAYAKGKNPFTKIKVREGFFNLSGIETQGQRLIGEFKKEAVSFFLFERIAQALIEMTDSLYKTYKVGDFLFVGGVSSSTFIREYLQNNIKNSNIKMEFGKPELSSDNAVGIALLGGKKIWL